MRIHLQGDSYHYACSVWFEVVEVKDDVTARHAEETGVSDYASASLASLPSTALITRGKLSGVITRMKLRSRTAFLRVFLEIIEGDLRAKRVRILLGIDP